MTKVAIIGDVDPAFVACAISLPGQSELADAMEVADPEAIYQARKLAVHTLSRELDGELRAVLEKFDDPPGTAYVFDSESCGRRALKNAALQYLAAPSDALGPRAECLDRVRSAGNMTDQIAALGLCPAVTAQNASMPSTTSTISGRRRSS